MPELKDTEWTFAADVASWINEILRDNPDLPFLKAKVERSKVGRRTRRDLEILKKDGRTAAISGEVKLPENPEGTSPYHHALVDSAHDKADEVGVDFFFTWNVNDFVLWKTYQSGVPLYDRDLQPFSVVDIRDSTELEKPQIVNRIKRFLAEFLAFFARILRGEEQLHVRPLDERFIHIMESTLTEPAAHTRMAVFDRYFGKPAFKKRITKWMVDAQGWTITKQTVDDCLERAAKLSCFVAANKLIFYNVLRKNFTLPPLQLPKRQLSIRDVRNHCEQHFDRAIHATGDYQTIFIEDFGGELAFLSDHAVNGWRDFIDQINAFDLCKLDYDLIGPIFERLISPEERHRFGQHYTNPDVVDLINTFCVRRATDIILDPSCGGGTFLVRGYALKKILSHNRTPHLEILQDLFGVDISLFATHLSTINLATRDLVHAANYPRVLRKDFFDLRDGMTVTVPVPGPSGGAARLEPLQLPRFDAIVGNPPYVRQEFIPDKPKLIDAVRAATPGEDVSLSKRSDMHIYFWPCCGSMLKAHGRMGLLASSSWPDVEYGYKLQKYLLDRYRIIAMFESVVEPWFVGARVATCATILEKEDDPKVRDNNLVRFVQLRTPIGDIIREPDDAKRFRRFLAFQKQILEATDNFADEQVRVRLIQQSDLFELGCRIPLSARDAIDVDDDEEDCEESEGVGSTEVVAPEFLDGNSERKYFGSKWGIYLRAPDFFFELEERFADKLCPLAEVATVKYGLKTGADDFFYVDDVTDSEDIRNLTDSQLKNKFGVLRRQFASKRIVRSGDGFDCPIEAKFLSPVIMSIMGIEALRVIDANAQKHLFTTSLSRQRLKGTFAEKYIRHGEQLHYHERRFIKNRTKVTGEWYDVGSCPIGDVLWAKAHQYRHIALANPQKLICNCRMYAITAHNPEHGSLLAAALNTTFTAFNKEYYGRILGREGNTDTMVGDCKLMLSLRLDKVPKKAGDRLIAAYEKLAQRSTHPFYPMGDELDQKDRQELDAAFFECLGVTGSTEQVEMRGRLYAEMRLLHANKRSLELLAIKNRRRTSRGGEPTPEDIASDIWEDFDKTDVSFFPDDFLGEYTSTELERKNVGNGDRIVLEGVFKLGFCMRQPA